MNILDTIITAKRAEVAQRKNGKAVSELENTPSFKIEALSFRDFLMKGDKTGIIAEFKRRSPSKGIINHTSAVKDVTAAYTKHGASSISILTDEKFFGGSLADLPEAVHEVPLLRKDFIIDEYQLIESKSAGADIILLIAACLSPAEVSSLAAFAKNIGLNVLLEIHDEPELEHICKDVDVVGINNRDLKTFTVDINRSLVLGNKIPGDIIKISESGIDHISSINLLKQHGFKGFLIGEKFMKEENPGLAFQNFSDALKREK